MGDILPFIARVHAGGDWTPTERARLSSLAEQFSKHQPGIEVAYGLTDQGDPWCVVKDADQEILAHVARIDGRFVVHYAFSNAVDEDRDLATVLSRRLSADEPFAERGAREMQILAALVVSLSFVWQAQGAVMDELIPAVVKAGAEPSPERVATPPEAEVGSREPGHAPVVDDPSDARPRPETAPAFEIEQPPTASTVAPGKAEPTEITTETPVEVSAPPAPTAPAAASADSAIQIAGGDGDDEITGSTATELILGGGGDDTLRGGGAAEGEFDTLVGGSGDDRIELGPQVIAFGGEGADVFVVLAPEAGYAGLLGVIGDYRPDEGDQVIDSDGHALGVTVTGGRPTTSDPTILAVDFDQDGTVDGYVMLLNGEGPAEPSGPFTFDSLPAHDLG